MESGKVTQLTKGEFDVSAADWSPDGNVIAFVANTREDADYTLIKDVWVVSSDGGGLRKVVEGRGLINSVAWSPDGKLLAYASMGPFDQEAKYRYGNIWIAPSEGGSPINLTEDFDTGTPAGGSSASPGAPTLKRSTSSPRRAALATSTRSTSKLRGPRGSQMAR